MIHSNIRLMLPVLAVLLAGVVQAAPDPQQVADRCIARASALADACVEANTNTTERAVERIAELLEAGKEKAAVAAARGAVQNVNRRSYAYVRSIERHCRLCVATLNRLAVPELAEEVERQCLEQLDEVRASREASVAAIREALPDPEEVPLE